MKTLKGQVAVITGASSGIGKACAYALAHEGVKVCLLGRNIEALKKIEAELTANSLAAKAFVVDLADSSVTVDVAKAVIEAMGEIHILVHSAGVFSMGTVQHADIVDLDHQYAVNVRAPYVLTQEFLPKIAKGSGQIVFVNSTVAMGAKAKISQYCATKSALKALADSLRSEVNPLGIRVLSLYPGRTASPMQEQVCILEGVPYQPEHMMEPARVAEVLVSSLTTPHDAEITDITIRPMKKY